MRWNRAGMAAAVGVALGVAQVAYAEGDDWELVSSGPLTVKSRLVADAEVYEYLVEGIIEADPYDLQTALTNQERFPEFMPHVEHTEVLYDGGNLRRVYTRINPPVGSRRDMVTEVRVHERITSDGTGTFRQTWRARPDAVPEQDGVTRIRINEGAWEITADASGHSRVKYRFRVHPGIKVPRFLSDLANKKAIPQTVSALVGEAERVGRERRTRADAAPRQQRRP